MNCCLCTRKIAQGEYIQIGEHSKAHIGCFRRRVKSGSIKVDNEVGLWPTH